MQQVCQPPAFDRPEFSRPVSTPVPEGCPAPASVGWVFHHSARSQRSCVGPREDPSAFHSRSSVAGNSGRRRTRGLGGSTVLPPPPHAGAAMSQPGNGRLPPSPVRGKQSLAKSSSCTSMAGRPPLASSLPDSQRGIMGKRARTEGGLVADQRLARHTAPARLGALTPPDPPPAEPGARPPPAQGDMGHLPWRGGDGRQEQPALGGGVQSGATGRGRAAGSAASRA